LAHIFMLGWDSKGGSENSPVDCFPAVGESLEFETHPVWMWMKSEHIQN